MANEEHLRILEKGRSSWNAWKRMRNTPHALQYEVDLSKADLSRFDLRDHDLSWADLSEANLYRANLTRASISESDLSGADLRWAKLNEANLLQANLLGANLRWADLSGINLSGANLFGANLSGAVLSRANLREAKLVGANLIDADLHGAALRKADMTDALLDNANMHQAVLGRTIFTHTRFAGVKGLETCFHGTHSIVDWQTLMASGVLPTAFLRGCGLPDTLIDFLPTLLAQPGQFPSLFISYSSKDEEFAQRLHSDLQDKGVRCWFAAHDMRGGKKLHEQIQEAIEHHDRLLLVLSRNSMNSEWVKTEIANARAREAKERKRVLFPIRLVDMEAIGEWQCFDADRGKDSAREVREYYIPDFQHWTDGKAYHKSLRRLLKDLKPEPRNGKA